MTGVQTCALPISSLAALGLRADLLTWVHGCEAADAGALTRLIELGARSGAALLLSTTSAAVAGRLAGAVGAVVAVGPASPDLAAQLTSALADGTRQAPPGAFGPTSATGAVGAGQAWAGPFPDEAVSRQ